MKIASMKIKNFRGYKNETEITFNDITAFVGKNDIGKSTILEALDIFFNDGAGVVKIDKDDVNKHALSEDDRETILSVCFDNLPDIITIDSTSQTTLMDEYMLNENGMLEVVKKYSNGGKAKVYIKAFHPTNPKCAELLLKNNAALKKIVQTESIECENLSNNVLLRKSIWEHFSEELEMQSIEIDVSKEGVKQIWGKLSAYMPVYSLFQSDRKNSDSDNEVQDPLKEAVKQIISDGAVQEKLTEVAHMVVEKLQDVSDRTLDKLREMDSEVADSLNPVIPETNQLKWADVFKSVSISGDENIPINKRGSGVKRLILLNFFRAEAERKADEEGGTGIIYAIEEPETSQHFANQRIIIESLKELAQLFNTQVIITTHSPIVVKELNFNNLQLVYADENGDRHIRSVQPSALTFPSLNEVIYIAFDEATEEYHDELYGFLDYHRLLSAYKQGKTQRRYIQQRQDGSTVERTCTTTEYVRHQIHHPENHHNTPYSKNELRESVDDMREFIHNHAGDIVEELWDEEE